MAKNTAKPTIYEYAGGAPAFLRLTQSFYPKVTADPLLKPVFKDFTSEHVRRVALWLSEVFGGPSDYSDTRGGHLTILGAHAGRHITKVQRDRWVELMLETAREVLPANEMFPGSLPLLHRVRRGHCSASLTIG